MVNSRLQRRANHIWRRRHCLDCGAIFTTEEHAALHTSLMVQRADGTLMPFSRDQLFASVHDSCRHRPNALDDATALTQTVTAELVRTQQDGIVPVQHIAKQAHKVLHRFDRTAATIYAAYHPAEAA